MTADTLEKVRLVSAMGSIRFGDLDIFHRIMLDIPGDENGAHLFCREGNDGVADAQGVTLQFSE